MKKIFSASSSAEAHMIEHALRERGINAFVQGEHIHQDFGQTIDVWIEEENEDQAKTIIKEGQDIQADQPKYKDVQNKKCSSTGFIKGLTTGILLALIGMTVYQKAHTSAELTDGWDSNGDGKFDAWAEYSRAL